MKILFLVSDLFQGKGGIQAFNNYLIKAMVELGHTLSVVSINDTKKLDSFHTYQFSSFRLSGKYKFLRKSVFVLNTFRQALSFRPDLIICGHINFSPLCIVISKIFNIPYFTVVHGIEAWQLNRLNASGLKNSSKILAVSRFTKNKILNQLSDYSEEDIFIIPNTFDSEKFKPKLRSKFLMDKLNIKNDEKVLLTIARLSKTEKYKGYDRVIVALKNVLKTMPNVKYILGGTGDDISRIKRLINDNGIEDKVLLTGFIPDEELRDYYSLCDVFIMPSKGEGFGIVFLEALACGKPVICGNQDGSVDAVLNGEVGILVDPDNHEEIKNAVVKALSGEVENKRLLDPKYLRKRIVEEYRFDKFRERVEFILNDRIIK